ncbi:unnamed protein product [Mytilus coruscus]|uniref:Uncharacterized protein n=1 Tax=Mytilus coruscus TaxID=42192 RepID=A0A6J8DDT4_MYTCO|nr:unnamed protein product [Mytilus coruscus]
MWFSLIHIASSLQNSKRLLLNDPDVVAARLHQLEVTQQSLLQIITKMNATITDVKQSLSVMQGNTVDYTVKRESLTNCIDTVDYTVKRESLTNCIDTVDYTVKRESLTNCMNTVDYTVKRESLTNCIDTVDYRVKRESFTNCIDTVDYTVKRESLTNCIDTVDYTIKRESYTAGQYYNAPLGGPANTLCLPDNPEIPTSSYTYHAIDLYGTEYETNFFRNNSQDEDMPCALCRNNGSSSSVMIPGRRTCYAGWNMEYTGILAAGSHGHSASNFICVDKDPEYIRSGKASDNGHLMYVVNVKCGSLPCPPYEENRQVYCVVCSK